MMFKIVGDNIATHKLTRSIGFLAVLFMLLVLWQYGYAATVHSYEAPFDETKFSRFLEMNDKFTNKLGGRSDVSGKCHPSLGVYDQKLWNETYRRGHELFK